MEAADVLDVADRLYSAALDASLWPEALAALSRQVGSDAWALSRQSEGSTLPTFFVGGGFALSESAPARYESHYFGIDPRIQWVAEMPVGTVGSCVREFGPRFVSNSEFYQDFLIPEGLRYVIGGCPVRASAHQYIAGALRSPDRGEFTPEDEAFYRRVMPHLTRAIQLMDRLDVLALEAESNAQATSACEVAVLTLSAQGRIRTCNGFAQALIKQALSVRDRAGTLALALHEDQRRLLAAMEKVRGSGHPETFTAGDRSGSGSWYSITISPLRGCCVPGVRLEPSAMFVCLIAPVPRRRVATVGQLISAFGFTAAEARLARAICVGATIDSYADESGLQVSTVRTQLHAVFHKLGVHRQPDAVRVIGSIPVRRS